MIELPIERLINHRLFLSGMPSVQNAVLLDVATIFENEFAFKCNCKKKKHYFGRSKEKCLIVCRSVAFNVFVKQRYLGEIKSKRYKCKDKCQPSKRIFVFTQQQDTKRVR